MMTFDLDETVGCSVGDFPYVTMVSGHLSPGIMLERLLTLRSVTFERQFIECADRIHRIIEFSTCAVFFTGVPSH